MQLFTESFAPDIFIHHPKFQFPRRKPALNLQKKNGRSVWTFDRPETTDLTKVAKMQRTAYVAQRLRAMMRLTLVRIRRILVGRRRLLVDRIFVLPRHTDWESKLHVKKLQFISPPALWTVSFLWAGRHSPRELTLPKVNWQLGEIMQKTPRRELTPPPFPVLGVTMRSYTSKLRHRRLKIYSLNSETPFSYLLPIHLLGVKSTIESQ